jgi:hypothetical protein
MPMIDLYATAGTLCLGIAGHAHTNAELVAAARAQLQQLSGRSHGQ